MVIRVATVDDIDTILDMGERFIAFGPHGKHVNADREQLRAGVTAFLQVGVMFLAERDGKVCGMLACAATPMWFAPHVIVAHELAWWVDEDARGSSAALRLVAAYEAWGRAIGAHVIAMSQLVAVNGEQVGRMLRKLGYEPSEMTYVKGA
jgi:N-acetylglutamate synthase-like GNAT family acetyltransferase